MRRGRPSAATVGTSADGGFTIVELMVTVVIIAILATIVLPTVAGDSRSAVGRSFSSMFARDLQRSQMTAVGTKRDVCAFIFLDRVEFREAQLGALPGDPNVLPVLATPPIRVLPAPAQVRIWNVTDVQTPPAAAVLTTATFQEVCFDGQGRANFLALPGQPLFIWVTHEALPAGHPNQRQMIDILPLTGFVRLRERWQ